MDNLQETRAGRTEPENERDLGGLADQGAPVVQPERADAVHGDFDIGEIQEHLNHKEEGVSAVWSG